MKSRASYTDSEETYRDEEPGDTSSDTLPSDMGTNPDDFLFPEGETSEAGEEGGKILKTPGGTSFSLVSDGLENTFAIVAADLKSQDLEAGTEVTINYLASVFLSKKSDLSATEVQKFKEFCSDTYVYFESESKKAAQRATDPDQLQIAWRTWPSQDLKDGVSSILIRDGIQIACGLTVDLSQNNGKVTAPLNLFLKPFLKSGNGLQGASAKNLSDALDEGLLLLDASLAPLPKGWVSFPVTSPDPTGLIRGVPSLRAKNIEFVTQKDKEAEPCQIATLDDFAEVLNPSLDASLTIDVRPVSGAPSGVDYKISAISLAEDIPENFREMCGKFLDLTTQNDGSFSQKLSCGDVNPFSMVAECGYQVNLENKNDVKNTVSVQLIQPSTNVNRFEVDSPLKAAELVPVDPDNKVANKKITFQNLEPVDIKIIQDWYNVLKDLAPEHFAWIDKITRIKSGVDPNYCTPDPKTSSGGYVDTFDTVEFNVCPTFMKGIRDGGALIFGTDLVSHESRHANGFFHDKDQRNYEPCTGTARTLEVYVKAFECKKIYCQGFKGGLKMDFLGGLEYNLGPSDSRRNQGFCKKMADDLGVQP